jgi:hypothetical protein
MHAHETHTYQVSERHSVRQQDGLVHRRHGVRDMRVEEGGALGRNDDVALAEEVEGTAAGHAVHRGDDRLP